MVTYLASTGAHRGLGRAPGAASHQHRTAAAWATRLRAGRPAAEELYLAAHSRNNPCLIRALILLIYTAVHDLISVGTIYVHFELEFFRAQPKFRFFSNRRLFDCLSAPKPINNNN